jgi:hypothetical protein
MFSTLYFPVIVDGKFTITLCEEEDCEQRFIHFPLGSQLEHRAPFRGFCYHTIRLTVELLWMSDQSLAETSTYTGQHNRQTSMPSAGFEPAITATKRPQTYLGRYFSLCLHIHTGCNVNPAAISRKQEGAKLLIYLHLLPKLGTHGCLPPCPFMCSVLRSYFFYTYGRKLYLSCHTSSWKDF